ncbi:DUF1097 domain-containing protein [Phormidium tenue FACHB-886]|nr:DUF1097 domain-containing protein [Phormidium tenue FACHB-886]
MSVRKYLSKKTVHPVLAKFVSRVRAMANRLKKLTNFFVTGGIAGIALWIGTALHWIPWVIYLTWVGYVLTQSTLSIGLKLLVTFVAGTLAAWMVVELGSIALPVLEQFALPVALFAVVGGIALLDKFPPFDWVPIYYMGMVAFFAAGAQPEFSTISALVMPATMGVFCGWLEVKLRLLLTSEP